MISRSHKPLCLASTFVRSDDGWLFVFIVFFVILFILFVLVIIVGRVLWRQAHDRDKARIDWPRGNILRHTQDHHVGVSLDFLGRYRARNQISESVASTCAA